jgi:transcriptional regulator
MQGIEEESCSSIGRTNIVALTEREKQILGLKKGNLSDYEIARKLRVDAGNVTRSRLTALRKIERAQADLDFALQVGVKIKFYT